MPSATYCGRPDRSVHGRAAGVDAQAVVERGVDFLEVHRAVLGFRGRAVGRADHLAGAHAAAGQQGARHVGPVVAAGLRR